MSVLQKIFGKKRETIKTAEDLSKEGYDLTRLGFAEKNDAIALSYFAKALEKLERAIALNKNLRRAWLCKAVIYSTLALLGKDSRVSGHVANAKSAIEKAENCG